MHSAMPSKEDFIGLTTEHVHDLVYEKRLNLSLLLNGTRRWYIAEHFDAPPKDNNYFQPYLEMTLVKLSELLTMLAEHGIYRVFIPVYSWHQPQRNAEAHKFLLKGIQALLAYPALVETYKRSRWDVRFYGDMTSFPPSFVGALQNPPRYIDGEPEHIVYFGVDGDSPHNHAFEMAYQFGQEQGRPPTREDMLEMYYGDRGLGPLNILIGFSRIYSRMGIPHLLDGEESIYITAITPLVMSQRALRSILHDYLYNRHDIGRDYQHIHPNEIQRLKKFYDANQHTVMGLTQKYEDLIYPTPAVQWPDMMNTPAIEPEFENYRNEAFGD